MSTTRTFLMCGCLISILLLSTLAWGADRREQASTVGTEWTRDYLMIVGSTTVFPFTTMVVDRLVQSGEIRKPMMQATGSGGVLVLFCAGAGEEDVDITCSSRRMRKREFNACAANGVGEIARDLSPMWMD